MDLLDDDEFDMTKVSLVPPAKEVSAAAASRDAWVTTFAMMLLSGVGIELCAERLGKQKSVLVSIQQTENFKSLLEQIARETDRDAAAELIRSAAVDSVMAMIKLRDTAKNEQVRLKAAMTLVGWNFFSREGALPSQPSAVADAMKKRGHDVSTSVDDEITALIKNSPNLRTNPLLAGLVTGADHRGQPESLAPGVSGALVG